GVSQRESLQRGQEIEVQGGTPGQRFDLAVMRREASDRIRGVALALRAIAGTPGVSQMALQRFRDRLSQIAPEFVERLGTQINQAQAAAGAAAGSSMVADLNSVAGTLEQVASEVEAARVHADRERTNARLVAQRRATLDVLARQPRLDTG